MPVYLYIVLPRWRRLSWGLSLHLEVALDAQYVRFQAPLLPHHIHRPCNSGSKIIFTIFKLDRLIYSLQTMQFWNQRVLFVYEILWNLHFFLKIDICGFQNVWKFTFLETNTRGDLNSWLSWFIKYKIIMGPHYLDNNYIKSIFQIRSYVTVCVNMWHSHTTSYKGRY